MSKRIGKGSNKFPLWLKQFRTRKDFLSNRRTFVQNRNENHALEAVEDQRQEKQLRPLTRFTLRVSSVHYFQIVTVGGLWCIREMSVRLRVLKVKEAPVALWIL
jgi:hypothetical protein